MKRIIFKMASLLALVPGLLINCEEVIAQPVQQDAVIYHKIAAQIEQMTLEEK